jgi:lipopolysaccharide/colanic/teichoic acid biosynthesis glycosyltransferase
MVDVTLSALALVPLSPVFLDLALLIKLTSKGPVFYRQTRCGLGGLRFTLLKFRSIGFICGPASASSGGAERVRWSSVQNAP